MIRGIIVGAFDLLHSGHLFTFREAKKYCDRLIVGLQVNPKTERPEKNKPVETIFERFNRLNACKYVDNVIPYETDEDLLNLLKTGDFDIRFLDEKYKENPENIVGEMLVPIKYIRRDHSWSSSGLRRRIERE